MATVKMQKGEKFADIYDSPETIKQAQIEGYHVVDEKMTGDNLNEDAGDSVAHRRGRKPIND